MGCTTGQVFDQRKVSSVIAAAAACCDNYQERKPAINNVPNAVRFRTQFLDYKLQQSVFAIARELTEGNDNHLEVWQQHLTKDDAIAIQQALTLDFPEAFMVGIKSYDMLGDEVQNINVDRPGEADLSYYLPNIRETERKVRELISGLTAVEAGKQIFKYVVENVEYLLDDTSESSSAICLSTKEGNQEGLAAAFEHLCNLAGIVCITIEVETEKKRTRFLNVICISGTWGIVDCGSAVQMREEQADMVYFGLSDAYLKELSVVAPKPVCNSLELNPVAQEGGVIENLEEDFSKACQYFAKCYQKGSIGIAFMFEVKLCQEEVAEYVKSVAYGAHRHLERSEIDLQRVSVQQLAGPCCYRVEVLKGPTVIVMKDTIVEIDQAVICEVTDHINFTLDQGSSNVVICFDPSAEFARLYEDLQERLQKIIEMLRGRREVSELRYLSDGRANVVVVSV